MEKIPYSEILKTKINVVTMKQAVDFLTENPREFGGKYVCVSNVHTTVMAYRDEKYRQVQNGSVLNLPDGKPLSIVQRHRKYENVGRVPGPDLMPEIFAVSEEKGYTHYFYGSRQETLDTLKKKLQERYPKLRIVGMYSPPFRDLTPEEDRDVIEMVRKADADFIWIGLGAPKQEKWMAAHEGCFGGVMLGVGAGFDFHAGTIRRAPKWMQEICMEWLFRIFQDPKRLLPRYIDTNFSFLWYIWKERGDRKKKEKRGESKKSLQIAMIGHKRIPSREGGVEIVVDELSTRMVKLGCQVDAYNRSGYHVSGKEFDEKRGKVYEGVRLITIPTFRNKKFNAIVYSGLATIVATAKAVAGKYDVIHYHAEGPSIMLWIPRLFGIRVVVTIHGLDWQRSKWGNFASRMLKTGERMAARHASEVIVLSRNVQDYFRETYGRETRFIPNGINHAECRQAKEIESRYGLEKDGYILFLARIVPEKGLHYLIDAFKRIKTDKKLVIAGGNSHSLEYLEEIRKMCEPDRRIILTGFIQGRILEELYSNAWLFVLPSDVEGMAISLLEAMSYGNCCLVSDIPENLEVVENHAFCFKKSDILDLKEKMEYLLANPDEVEKKKAESSAYICKRYNWDEVVKETLKLYRDRRC